MYSALLGLGAHISHLLEFVGDHGKSLEDGIGGAGDGHNSLRAVSFRDVDSCPALQKRRAALEQPQPGKLGGMCWRHSSFFGLYPACLGKAEHTTVGTQRAGQKSSGGSQLGCPCRKAECGVTATHLSQGNEPLGQLWPWFCMLLALPTPHPSVTNYFMDPCCSPPHASSSRSLLSETRSRDTGHHGNSRLSPSKQPFQTCISQIHSSTNIWAALWCWALHPHVVGGLKS